MPEAAKDCPSCGVYIEKYQEMVQAESPLLFELNQLWVKVVENFTDDQRHQNFLNLCQQRMALNFAFQKYDEVRKIVNYDESCEKYLKQIELRLQQQFLAKQTSGELPNQKTAQESKTFQWIFAIIGFVGLGLLIFNKIRPTFPNLTGLVVSITVLSFGLWILSSQNAVRGKNIKL